MAGRFVSSPARLVCVTWYWRPADAQRRQVADFVHHRRHVQQRLGWDAADVQAHAAERGVALDDDHLQAQIGGAESGRIAARAATQDDDVAVEVGGAAKTRSGWRRLFTPSPAGGRGLG